MNSEVRNKWQIRAATLSIFLLGAIAGAFALNAYYLWFGGPRQLSREERFQKMVTDLKLTPEQTGQMQQIVDDIKVNMQAIRKENEPKMNALRDQADEKTQKILTPEQWQKFVQMRDARKAEDKQQRETR
jgi:Spy/CpxP family protein refolding chaperone